MKKIILARSNAGKISEIEKILNPLGWEITPQHLYQVSSVPETGLTFVENAIIKARHASQCTGLPAIADDSGLEVSALNGAPGIYSSRHAGEDATDSDNIQKLLQDLDGIEQRQARFYCVIVFLTHPQDPTPIIAEGYWNGSILNHPQGEHGFGYDPIFYVPEEKCSAAQLKSDIKNKQSHRAMALSQLQKKLNP